MNLSPITLMVELVYTPIANYAIQQNKIPIVKKVIIENSSDSDLFDLKLEIIGEPEFLNKWTHIIEMLPQKQRIEVEANGITLSSHFLSGITERLAGELQLSISSKGNDLFKEKYNVDVLAYDQWNGIGAYPEILAAYVTPNHPEISKIIKDASVILKKWTGDPSFNAYQSFNTDRVKKQLGAIYETIANLGIVYCTPPASFEKEGQRIRTCDTIFSQRLATCIDISILYACCIEAIGLNPLLIIMKGHAFVGAWLVDDTFSDSVSYDVSLLKKRAATGINEIILVEAVCMNAGNTQSFDESINLANYKLVKEEEFILFVDVKRSRYSGIKPLPQRIKTNNGWEIIEDKETAVRESQLPESIIDKGKENIIETNSFTKQKLWERKLLDLSLRNNLLNLRITQSTIQLLSLNLNTFEDALASGDEFQILAKPEEWVSPNIKSGVYPALNMSDPIINLLKFELSNKRLRTYLTDSELKLNLTKLYRTSRLSVEENGANTLYLALGFLKWYETPQSELARYAPILLLPIEIIRKSAQTGYVIRSREEDTLMNITLLEMLKQDFRITIDGLEELPRDESGVDVIQIFNRMRRRIMTQPRWDLEEHAFLGIFSFSKFIMWNDIHMNAAKLSENKIVKSLITGKLEWESNEIPVEIDPDDKYHPSKIALPISADSTQLEAICAAADDKSFILHGPPGTGKSQTITNIISNALYQGKKVLFVAEKMAALSVVQKRLSDIGLAPFCLELHSNKTKKSLTLEQLRRTAEAVKKSSPAEFATEAERLHQQRAELNKYVKALHKKYPFGFSLFDSFSRFAEFNNLPDNIQFEEAFIEALTNEKFIEYCDLIEELQNAGTICGHPHNHNLTGIGLTTYSQQIKIKSQELITEYIELLKQKIAAKVQLSELLEIDGNSLNKEKTEYLKVFAETITSLPDIPLQLINAPYPGKTLDNIIDLANHGNERDNYRKKLLSTFTTKVLDLEAEQKLAEWNTASQKWFLPRYLEQSKLLKTLKLHSKDSKVNKSGVVKYLETLILYQKEQKLLDENSEILSGNLDFLWNSGNSDWEMVIRICKLCIQINQILILLIEDISKVKKIKSKLSDLLSGGTSASLNNKRKILLDYIDIVNQQKEIEDNLSELLKIDFFSGKDTSQDWTEYWLHNAENWLVNLESLRDWTSWNRIKQKAVEAGLTPIVDSYILGRLKNEEVLASFKKALYKHFAEYIISKDSSLSEFNGKLFERKIHKFQQQSKYFEELTKAELFAVLASKIPSFTVEASNSSEVGILQRAIRNNGRGMSIRRLFDLIPNLLPRMCPCMLMSPISVAQYFEVDKSKFDLVIFDEASQMPTCEAVGAIARGENVIVVGDPKQMPPTNFFSTNYFDEENADKEDLESILDDCLALSMPSKYLLWHYRSKHESLIAFSNANYYENKLLTFPSPDDLTTKVSNIFVPGHYDRGKTRQNSFEAKAIVEEVIIRLSDPILLKKSIGIVTFNASQQNLIEDILNEEFKKRPDLEKIALESFEPIFIKNLENVQGDERDIILFSVGYGPDKDGEIYLNFGPLNRDGGWRRLNVAISRARYEMKVYSTLRSDQIDISRTSSEGVAGLKAFLEYSEKGKRVLPQKNIIKKTIPRYFEKMVAEEIQKRGYSVQTDIGCSGFRIDIGIVNPEKDSEYILGILADGKSYLDSKTAKDREVIKSDVLRMLGWNIYKLWSPDWWDNPQKVIEDIIHAIKNLLNQKKELVIQDNETKTIESLGSKGKEYNDVKLQGITQQIIQPVHSFREYKSCKLEKSSLNNSDEFFDSYVKPKIIRQIQKVMEIEAPISHALLSRRVLNAWGISRLGARLNEYLSSLYSQLQFKCTTQNDAVFYWLSIQEPESYDTFRVPGEDDQKRNAEDLAKEEIANGIKEVLNNQISLPQDDLVKEAAHIFGFTRKGGNVEQAIQTGIDYAIEINLIINKDMRYILPGK